MLYYIHRSLAALVLLVAQACMLAEAATPCYDQPMQGQTCGVAGTIYYHSLGYVQYYADVSSILDCRTLCFSNYCQILAYDAGTQNCTAIAGGATLQNTHFTPDPNSNTLVYQFPCFDCTYPCPPPVANMLAFADFETPLAAFNSTYPAVPWGVSEFQDGPDMYGTIVTPGYNSEHAFKIGSFYYLFQDVRTCPGGLPGAPSGQQRYELSFAYNLDVPENQTGQIIIGFADAQYTYSDLKSTPAGTWVNFTDYFPFVPKSPDIQGNRTELLIKYFDYIGRFDNGTGSMTVDSFSLIPIFDEPGAEPGTTELLGNGGFDTGHLAPWKFKGVQKHAKYAITSPGSNGSKHALTVSGDRAHFVQKMIGLEEGQLYSVQYYSKLEGHPACQQYPGSVSFYLNNNDDVDAFYGYDGSDIGKLGVWTQRGFDFIATSAQAIFEFEVYTTYINGPCSISVDGFSLQMAS